MDVISKSGHIEEQRNYENYDVSDFVVDLDCRVIFEDEKAITHFSFSSESI